MHQTFPKHPKPEVKAYPRNIARLCATPRSRFSQMSPALADRDVTDADLEEALLLLQKAFPERASPGWAVEATLRFNRMIIAEELDYRRRQAYRHAPGDAGKVNAEIYQSGETMTGFYLAGLMLSYYTWSHHKDLLALFHGFLDTGPKGAYVMEWGTGHGLLSLLAARQWPSARLLALDISPHSLAFTAKLLAAAGIADRSELMLGDVLDPTLDFPQVDRLICAEVLEHVAEPGALIQRAAAALAGGGRAFFTAAINAPQPDHIFHFRCESEVEALIRAAGLSIESKTALVHPHRAGQDKAPTVFALTAIKG